MAKTDLLWEACMIVECGEAKPNLIDPERRRLGKLVSAVRATGATPEEVQARAKRYKQVMPAGCMLTLAALANHWSKLTPAKRSPPQASYVSPTYTRPTQEQYRQALECLPASIRNRLERK